MQRDTTDFQRVAAVAAILAAPVSYLLTATLLRALSFDFTILGTPSELIAIGPGGARVFKWTMVLDSIGQYLLLLPLVVFLWYWLQPRAPLTVSLLTSMGLVYIFVGALGVAINAAVFPELMVQYAEAGPNRQAVLETVFTAFANALMMGSWGIFVRLMGGVYWVGIGVLLREERRAVGYFTILLGVVTVGSAIGNVLQLDPLIGIGTLGYLLGFPLWALWLGIVLYRTPLLGSAVQTE